MSQALTKPELETLSQIHPVLFFDGVCGLCNHSVDFVVRRDQARKFRFSPLQGETAAAGLAEADRLNLSSLVLMKDKQLYRKSAAVVRILWELPFLWQCAGTLLWLIPLPLRNLGYTLVARSRYQLFGQKESCRLPSPQERAQFLD